MTSRSAGKRTGPRSLHAFATTGVAVFAVTGLLAVLAFITVGWPGDTGRYLVAVFMGSIIGCFACASAALFTAMRGTHSSDPDE
jgi:ABC-type amino acid transport system permease subunit